MTEIVSFGEWVQTRRNQLRYTRKAFADLVGCAPITIKKIERDERRPSLEMAELLAVHLQIPESEQEDFLRRARGEYVPRMVSPLELSLAEAQQTATAEEAPKHNLPAQTTPFFGRKRELADIAANLADPDCRLLTILAAGGMGKTRLGIEAAAAQLQQFTDGVTYVPLAAITAYDSGRVANPLAAALVDALGISFHGDDVPEQQMFAYLRRKEMLIVFDNFEHLLEASVFISDLLHHALDVKLLITSRERLNLQEEWLYPLQGLSFPEHLPSTSEAIDYDAFQLFAQRARQVRPSFALAEELPDVFRICRLVEGMPLGLELAAAWVYQLSCAEIADEIASEISFLSTPARNVPERQRSLRAVFDYSWQKLTGGEKDVMRKLSVFRGGFDRAAAKAVAGASLPILASLTDKSLLTISRNGRYAIHEILRQFAAQKLADLAGLEQETQDLHAHYFLIFVRDQKPRLSGPEGLAALAAMYSNIDNIRLAIRWAVQRQLDLFDPAAAESLRWLFDAKGWFLEGTATFGRIISLLKTDCFQQNVAQSLTVTQNCLRLAYYQAGLGWCKWWLGQYKAVEETSERVLRAIPLTKDPAAIKARAKHLSTLGWARFWKGDLVRALNFFQQVTDLYQEIDDSWSLIEHNLVLFNVYIVTGEYDRAEKCLFSARQLAGQLQEQIISIRFWNEMGKLAMIRGQLAAAEDYFRESLARYADVEGWSYVTFVWRERGDLARLQGNLSLAREYYQQSVDLAEELNAPYPLTQSFWSYGKLALDEGQYERALYYFEKYKLASTLPQEFVGGPGWALLALARNEEAQQDFAASLQLMVNSQARPIGLDALVGMAHLKARTGQFEEAVALLALVRTHSSTHYESREKARKLYEELAAELPAELVAAAEARGRAMDLWATAESLLAEAKAAGINW